MNIIFMESVVSRKSCNKCYIKIIWVTMKLYLASISKMWLFVDMMIYL